MNQNLEILERITIRSIEALERVCCEAARSLSGTSSMASSGDAGPRVGGSVENTAGAAASSAIRSDRIQSAKIRAKEQSVSADKVSTTKLNVDAIRATKVKDSEPELAAEDISQTELSENAVTAAALDKAEADKPADCSYPVELPDGTTTVCTSYDELMEVYAEALRGIPGWKEIEAFNKLNGKTLVQALTQNGETEERIEALRELASDAFKVAWKKHEAATAKAEESDATEAEESSDEEEGDVTSFVVRNGRGTEVSTLNDPDEVVSVLSDAFAKCRKPDTVKTLLRHNEDMIASLPREQADAVLDASQVAIEELEAKAGKSKASEEKADAQEEAPQEREEPKSDKPKTLANDDDDDDEPSRDKLRELIQTIADTRGFSTAMSVLVNLGTGKLRDLPDDKIPEAYAAAKELLEADA